MIPLITRQTSDVTVSNSTQKNMNNKESSLKVGLYINI